MRALTFSGFLTRYVRQLSLNDTTSLFTLAKEAAGPNPRLREPVALYALWSGKEALLVRAAKDSELAKFYSDFFANYSKDLVEQALKGQAPPLSEAFHKVWRSYKSVQNQPAADSHTKELMRKKLLRLQEKKGITNYRLYTDLKLNPGNFNAWLKHGESRKVSLETARRALRYTDNA